MNFVFADWKPLDTEILFERCADQSSSILIDLTIIEVKLHHALVCENKICDWLRSQILKLIIPKIEVLKALVLHEAFAQICGFLPVYPTIGKVKQLEPNVWKEDSLEQRKVHRAYVVETQVELKNSLRFWERDSEMLKAKRLVITPLIEANAVSWKVYVGDTCVIVQELGEDEKVLGKKVALWKVQQDKVIQFHLVERHTPSINCQFLHPFIQHEFGHILQPKFIQIVVFEIYMLI